MTKGTIVVEFNDSKGLTAHFVHGGINLAEDFPLFHLIVTAWGYTLVNETGYETDKDGERGQVGWLKQYSKRNIDAGGVAVKRVIVVAHSNTCNYDLETYTYGWKPVQDIENKENNTKRAYLIEFMDGISTDWMCWDKDDSLEDTVWKSVDVVYDLAKYFLRRVKAQEAYERSSAVIQRQKTQ